MLPTMVRTPFWLWNLSNSCLCFGSSSARFPSLVTFRFVLFPAGLLLCDLGLDEVDAELDLKRTSLSSYPHIKAPEFHTSRANIH